LDEEETANGEDTQSNEWPLKKNVSLYR
jgi:hypothetical protein